MHALATRLGDADRDGLLSTGGLLSISSRPERALFARMTFSVVVFGAELRSRELFAVAICHLRPKAWNSLAKRAASIGGVAADSIVAYRTAAGARVMQSAPTTGVRAVAFVPIANA
jgi:hypothetical protein